MTTDLERVKADDLSHRQHMNRVIATADVIASSNLVRSDLAGEDVRAIAITLDQMGIPPTLMNINAGYVVKGRVDFMARIWAALAARAGYDVWPDDASDDRTGVAHIRNGRTGQTHTVTFTWEDAAKAGLTGSDTYKKYGRDMLIWRAMSRAVRWHAPDVVAGIGEAPPETVSRPRPRPAPVVADPDDDIVDGELVEQGEDVHLGPEIAVAPPGQETDDEQSEVYAKRCRRANAVMGEVGVKSDDARHELVRQATGGTTQSTGRLTHGQVEAIVAHCQRLKTAEQSEEGGSRPVPPVPPSSGPTVPPLTWRERAKAGGVKDAHLLKKAREFAAGRDLPQPSSLDEITDEQVLEDLREWLGE